MSKARIQQAKSITAVSVSLFLTVSSPGSLFAAQFIGAAAKARVKFGVTPVSVKVGMPAAGGALSSVSSLGLTHGSVLPSLTSVVPALSRSVGVSPSAVVPAAAVQAVVKEGAAPGRKAAGEKVSLLSREISAAVDSVGPMKEASPSQAHGLGGTLTSLLTHGSRRGASASAVAAPQASRMGNLLHSADNTPGEAGGDFSRGEEQRVTKAKMVETLRYIATIFSDHYAPLDWKNDKFGVVLKEELAKATQKINDAPYITTQQYQVILRDFTSAMKDHHVGIQFYSTEMARLPFDIENSGGKYYITYIDRAQLPMNVFPYKVGDQIVEFDGRPVAEAAKELLGTMGAKSRLTDAAMADMRLTRRIRQAGDVVPQGPVKIKILTQTGEFKKVTLQWQYQEELVPEDVPARDGGNLVESMDPLGPIGSDVGPFAQVWKALRNFLPNLVNPVAKLFGKAFSADAGNPNQIGARESFVPALGEKVWEAPAGQPFHAYIYKNAEGKKIGFIRISDYVQPDEAADLFGHILMKFQAETEGLVIDQVNNPGGSLFYMYALLSRLTDKPLKVSRQRIITSEAEAMQAAQVVAADQMVRTDMDAMRVLGPSLGGYPVTLKVWKQFVSYFKFILAQLREGKRFTDLTYMMGIEEIAPHPTQRYTKPITLLVNEKDFSSADFFAATLQDNKRARLFGRRTAGAGGAVQSTEFPNQFGIAMLAYTFTIAFRDSGLPIENLGVVPDERYVITGEDFRNGYQGYKDRLNKVVSAQVKREGKPTPPAAEPAPEETRETPPAP